MGVGELVSAYLGLGGEVGEGKVREVGMRLGHRRKRERRKKGEKRRRSKRYK